MGLLRGHSGAKRGSVVTKESALLKYYAIATDENIKRYLLRQLSAQLKPEDPAEPEASADSETSSAAGQRPLNPLSFSALAEQVRSRGPQQWLIQSLWVEGDYGVISGAQKSQKTWTAIDLAVSVATGTGWLGSADLACKRGTVIYFIGEGGPAHIVQRIEAVARSKGLDPDEDLSGLYVETLSPRLGSALDLEDLARWVEELRPALVIIDPLYLSVGKSAHAGQLNEMGELLGRAQRICQPAGAALIFVHHNKKGSADGSDKMTGAGPAEWGRVLVVLEAGRPQLDPETKAETRSITLSVSGQVPSMDLTITRTIGRANWTDPNSPFDYAVTFGGFAQPDGSSQKVTRQSGAAADRLKVIAVRVVRRARKELGTNEVWALVKAEGESCGKHTLLDALALAVAEGGLLRGDGPRGAVTYRTNPEFEEKAN